MIDIILHPEEVWGYCTEHKNDLTTIPETIAIQSSIYGDTEIMVSYIEGDQAFNAEVLCNGELIDVSIFDTEEQCLSEIASLYSEYMTDDPDNLDYEYNTMLIEDREDELNALTIDYLKGILGSDIGLTMDIVEDLKEKVLDYIYKTHDFEIYRPMYLKGNTGDIFYTEYPYLQMI